MRRVAIRVVLAIPLLGLPLAGCGGDAEERAERGLAPPDEAATPESEQAMKQTEAERQQQVTDEMQKAQEEEFDRENAGEDQ